ncbi:hypothetical protein M433DRAFT_83998 [Acidomyces richmondensis BFW]|nr:MAG: hypothetical protein FE78DRAFT_158503 [Acidomyces sp. 'richmondensis']KYG48400.1 hypothetical protein M433DRAFT_83998 [Acidomyces richmondensis BFW]
MGWLDYLTDITSAFAIGETAADHPPADETTGDNAAPRGGVSTKSPASGTDEESGSEKEANDADTEKSQGGNEEEEEEEDEKGGDDEEEEEEEVEDLKPKFEEECMKTQECAPLKHHYEECAERVQQQVEEHGKAQEDCVEEFFHMMHCASQCAAPKLFRALR